MASQAYYNWVADGKPVKYARPIADLRDTLRRHGYTVYDIGNSDHLTKDVPEDHTPFSMTGWPGKSPYPYVLAIDIMPPASGERSNVNGELLPSLQKLAARMRADKIAGHPGMQWLKYMNWEPSGNNTGDCWHDSWTPDYARRSSSDRGHIHMSGRTDYYLSGATATYDPVALLTGDDMTQDEFTKLLLGALKNPDVQAASVAANFQKDNVIGAPAGAVNPDGTPNKYWAVGSYITGSYALAQRILAQLAELAGKDYTDETLIAQQVLDKLLEPERTAEEIAASLATIWGPERTAQVAAALQAKTA